MKFVTYTTYVDEDPKVILWTPDFTEDDLPDDWDEWVLQETANAQEAIEKHDVAFTAWQNGAYTENKRKE